MNAVLKAQGLSFTYGGEPVLAGVSFEAVKGDFIAVLGSNGAGKSTLLKLLLGELAPDSGSISLFGEDVAKFKAWPKIGYVPQSNPSSNAGFPATVEEVVCASLYSQIGLLRPVRSIHREKALRALSLVGVRDLAKRMISELSGGQLQRVMIARVLAADCEIILMDEPTSGVDSASSASLYKLLKSLNENGMTIMLVTHDAVRAAQCVNRVLCLEEGSIVELDKAQLDYELRHRHKHPHL